VKKDPNTTDLLSVRPIGLLSFRSPEMGLLRERDIAALRGQRLFGAPITYLSSEHRGLRFESPQVFRDRGSRGFSSLPFGFRQRRCGNRLGELRFQFSEVLI